MKNGWIIRRLGKLPGHFGALWIIVGLAGGRLSAAPTLSHVYQVDWPESSDVIAGSVQIAALGPNQATIAISATVPNGETSHTVTASGPIGRDGLPRWLAYYLPDPTVPQPFNAFVGGNATQASLIDRTVPGKLVVAGFGMPSATLMFAKEISVAEDPTKNLSYGTPDGGYVVVWDSDSSVSLLTLDSNGEALVDKTYTSPSFLSGSIPVGTTQASILMPQTSDDGLYLLVQSYASKPTGGFDNLYTFIRLNLLGEVQWARTLEFEAAAFNSIQFTAYEDSDGSLYVPISDIQTTFDSETGNTRQEQTKILKIGSDGSLVWKREIQDAILSMVFPWTVTGGPDYFWMSGYDSPASGTEDGEMVILKMDAIFGVPQKELRFPSTGGFVRVVHETSDRIYATVTTRDSPNQLDLICSDKELENPKWFRFNGNTFLDFRFRGEDEILVTDYDVLSLGVRAISLDGDLQALNDHCPSPVLQEFTPITPALITADFDPTLNPVTVEAVDSGTTFMPATPSLQLLPVRTYGCDGILVMPDDHIAVTPFLNESGHLILRFKGVAETEYELLHSSNLVSSFEVTDTITGGGPNTDFVITDLSPGKGFFLIRKAKP